MRASRGNPDDRGKVAVLVALALRDGPRPIARREIAITTEALVLGTQRVAWSDVELGDVEGAAVLVRIVVAETLSRQSWAISCPTTFEALALRDEIIRARATEPIGPFRTPETSE